MITEITTQLTPLVRSLSERYRSSDIVQSLMNAAFDLHHQHEKIPAKALNTFRAHAEQIARARLGQQNS